MRLTALLRAARSLVAQVQDARRGDGAVRAGAGAGAGARPLARAVCRRVVSWVWSAQVRSFSQWCATNAESVRALPFPEAVISAITSGHTPFLTGSGGGGSRHVPGAAAGLLRGSPRFAGSTSVFNWRGSLGPATGGGGAGGASPAVGGDALFPNPSRSRIVLSPSPSVSARALLHSPSPAASVRALLAGSPSQPPHALPRPPPRGADAGGARSGGGGVGQSAGQAPARVVPRSSIVPPPVPAFHGRPSAAAPGGDVAGGAGSGHRPPPSAAGTMGRGMRLKKAAFVTLPAF